MEDDVPATVATEDANEEEQGGCCKKANSLADPRLPYLIVMFLLTITAGVFAFVLRDATFEKMQRCPEQCTTSRCCGSVIVYRIMFGAFFFYLTLAIISKIPSCSNLSASGWFFKLVYLAALLGIGFVLPYQVLEVFKVIWIVVSGIFLVIQIILMLDFAITWNEEWVKRDWKGPVLACATLMYVISLAAFIVLWIYMADGDKCSQEKTFIIVTLVVTLLFTIISVMSETIGKGVLPVATVTVYCYWLLYAALSDNTKLQCNRWAAKGGDNLFTVLFGFLTAAATVTYAGFNVSRKSRKLKTTREETAGVSAFNFHLTMSASAAYAAMSLTQWGLDSATAIALNGIPKVVYVQLSSQWVCMLLFTWMLFAPVLFPNREFDF